MQCSMVTLNRASIGATACQQLPRRYYANSRIIATLFDYVAQLKIGFTTSTIAESVLLLLNVSEFKRIYFVQHF